MKLLKGWIAREGRRPGSKHDQVVIKLISISADDHLMGQTSRFKAPSEFRPKNLVGCVVVPGPPLPCKRPPIRAHALPASGKLGLRRETIQGGIPVVEAQAGAPAPGQALPKFELMPNHLGGHRAIAWLSEKAPFRNSPELIIKRHHASVEGYLLPAKLEVVYRLRGFPKAPSQGRHKPIALRFYRISETFGIFVKPNEPQRSII